MGRPGVETRRLAIFFFALVASSIASRIVWPSTNCLPSNCTARSVAATTLRAPNLPNRPLPSLSGKNFFDKPIALDARRAMVLSPLASKSALPSWSAVKAIAVSTSGTRSSASARRISASPSALDIGYSLSRLSIAQNGGGFLRTACTQGWAICAAAAQSSAACSGVKRLATTEASGR